MPRPLILIALLCASLCAGCPQPEPGAKGTEPDPARFAPASAIPAGSPLIAYDKLKLGMSSLEIAQAYNAPEGKGKGFSRMIEDMGAASNHIIDFDAVKGSPKRRIVLRVYRDQLCKLVDRRDGLTAQQADDWFAALKKQYGGDCRMTVPGAQWSWGDKKSVLLTFTRDNASDTDMNANVVLVHQPSYDSSLAYLEEWQILHPPAEKGQAAPAAGTPADTGTSGI